MINPSKFRILFQSVVQTWLRFEKGASTGLLLAQLCHCTPNSIDRRTRSSVSFKKSLVWIGSLHKLLAQSSVRTCGSRMSGHSMIHRSLFYSVNLCLFICIAPFTIFWARILVAIIILRPSSIQLWPQTSQYGFFFYLRPSASLNAFFKQSSFVVVIGFSPVKL